MDVDRFSQLLGNVDAVLSMWDYTKYIYDLDDELIAQGNEVLREAREAARK